MHGGAGAGGLGGFGDGGEGLGGGGDGGGESSGVGEGSGDGVGDGEGSSIDIDWRLLLLLVTRQRHLEARQAYRSAAGARCVRTSEG